MFVGCIELDHRIGRLDCQHAGSQQRDVVTPWLTGNALGSTFGTNMLKESAQ
jgi:hypothetical protein